MEVPNDSSEKIYEELYTEASEGFGMSANQSYGGMASTRDEEEVHTYEGIGMGEMASGGIASPRAEEDFPSNEARRENQRNSLQQVLKREVKEGI
jgi:hypothetical protein